MRTGILGGTFDPIHIAHLHAGECALHQASLDRVVFMPAGDPWQKPRLDLTPGHHRMTMTRIAIEGVPGFEADSREIDRAGPTYTIDTVESFPEDEELFLILGADAAMGIPTWHRANELVERVTLLIVPRAGTDSTNVARLLPRSVFLDMAVLEVSGTEIRLLAGSGHPFRFLLTSAVHGYIKKQGLYTETRRDDMVGGHMETEQS